MKCSKCGEIAVFPGLCKSHFMQYVEEKVKDTIGKYDLIPKNSKIIVAMSGGKDSQTVAYLLHKFGYEIEAICIDEGIAEYRENTIQDLEKFCNKFAISFKVYSFKDEWGFTLDSIGGKCRTCGVLRRYLLNKYSNGYDLIATGHNFDDELQSVVMNLFKGNDFLAGKIGPKSGFGDSAFVQRVKPLYFLTEKEIMTYTFLMGFPVDFTECPYATGGFRARIRKALLLLNRTQRENMIKWFLNKNYETPHKRTIPCSCGQPSKNGLCKTCQIVESIMSNQ